jgi:hypothetical protein
VQKVVHPPEEFVCDGHPSGGCVGVRLGRELARAAGPSFLDSSGVHVLGTAPWSAERAPAGDA